MGPSHESQDLAAKNHDPSVRLVLTSRPSKFYIVNIHAFYTLAIFDITTTYIGLQADLARHFSSSENACLSVASHCHLTNHDLIMLVSSARSFNDA